MNNLKPCPFCGADVDNVDIEKRCGTITKIHVKCCSCGADVEIKSSYVEGWNGIRINIGSSAIDKWNRRASDENQSN